MGRIADPTDLLHQPQRQGDRTDAGRRGSAAVPEAARGRGVSRLAVLVAAAAVLGVAAWRWSRTRAGPEPSIMQSQNGQGPIDPELDRRLDEELARFE